MIMQCLGAIQWDDPVVFGPVAAAVVTGVFALVIAIRKRKNQREDCAPNITTTVKPNITVSPQFKIENKPSAVFTNITGLDEASTFAGWESTRARISESFPKASDSGSELHRPYCTSRKYLFSTSLPSASTRFRWSRPAS